MDCSRPHEWLVDTMVPCRGLSFNELSSFPTVSTHFWPPKVPLKNHRYAPSPVCVWLSDGNRTENTASSRCRVWSFRFQPSDPPQNLTKELTRDGHLGQLKRHVLRVPHDLGPDFHQLLPQRRERPVFDTRRQLRTPEEVAQAKKVSPV